MEDALEMPNKLKSKKIRNSYLSAVDAMSKTWRNDLNTKASQLAARHNIIEAISAIRGTLAVVKNVGPDFGHGFKWSGGAVCPDGRVFFAPHGAEHVLCINPFDGSISTFGDIIPTSASKLTTTSHERKFSDAVIGPRGLHLYLIPASSRYVLKLDLSLGTWDTINSDVGGQDWKWGGALLFGHRIYCAPHNSNRVMVIDCKRDTVSMIGNDDLGSQSAKWGAPVIVPLRLQTHAAVHVSQLPANEVVILFPPLNASQVLLLNPKTHQTALVGEDFGQSFYKYEGGCVGADGSVYCAPSCAPQFLRIEVIGVLEEFNPLEYQKSLSRDEIDELEEDHEHKMKPLWKSSLQRMKKEHSITEPSPTTTTADKRKTPTTSLLSKRMINLVNTARHHSGSSASLLPKSKNRASTVTVPTPSNSPPKLALSTAPLGKSLDTVQVKSHAFSAVSPKAASVKPDFPTRFAWPPQIKCSYHGLERAGNFKFGSTVMSADGKTAIAVPMNLNAFISIDTSSKERKKPVHRMGSKLVPENLRFGGGVVGVDGYLYCAPLQATRVMRVDTIALSRHQQQKDYFQQLHHHSLPHTNKSNDASNDDDDDDDGGGGGADHHSHHHHKRTSKLLNQLSRRHSQIRSSFREKAVSRRQSSIQLVAEESQLSTENDSGDEAKGDVKDNGNSQSSLFSVSSSIPWLKTSEAIFNVYMNRQDQIQDIKNLSLSRIPIEKNNEEDEDNDDDDGGEKLSARKAMIAIATFVHWRQFAASRARLKQGFSASEKLVRNKDKQMRALLLLEPEIWCYGLTLKNSSIPDDLCDWLEMFSETEAGSDFINVCGVDTTSDIVTKVAKTPNLAYSLITLEKNEILMKLPIIRRAIMKPYVFEGDWLVQCLSNRKLMESAVKFIELVSKDIEEANFQKKEDSKKRRENGVGLTGQDAGNVEEGEENDDDGDAEPLLKNETFSQIAAIDHFVSPMLKLPRRLQDRIASTELMAAILDELFIERPLALVMIIFDFLIILIILNLLIRATWEVQHDGALNVDEILVVVTISCLNCVYIIREYINWSALRKLGLTIGFSKSLDLLTMGALFAIVGMSFSEVRLKPIFIVVASATSGLCWLKLLGFLSSIHLQFAVYIEALKLITKALRIYILTLSIFLAMFGNMFYVIMSRTGYNDDDTQDDDDTVNSIYDRTFTHFQTSFLTLFRMLLGDFEMEWFRRDGEQLLTAFAYFLFVSYMFGVFIIMLNVLIAVVCDNYSFAMSKAHEIFLRSRLQTVANLDMQGITKLRNNNTAGRFSGGVALSTTSSRRSASKDNGTVGGGVVLSKRSISGHTKNHRGVSLEALLQPPTPVEISGFTSPHQDDNEIESQLKDASTQQNSFLQFFDSIADWIDLLLKDSLWHFYMKKFLSIRGQTKAFKKTSGRSKSSNQAHDAVEGEAGSIGEMIEFLAHMDERMILIEEQQLLSEARIIQDNHKMVTMMSHMEAKLSAQIEKGNQFPGTKL